MDEGTKLPPNDCFREIGFDTSCWPDRVEETIFFLHARYVRDPQDENRIEKVSKEAVEEFVGYWQHQIDIAKEYLANDCNPNTHEWKTK